MDLRILGTAEAHREGHVLDLGPVRQRALLARLLVAHGDAVSSDGLIDALWPEDIPESARHTLHVYVSRLRQALGPDRDRLETLPSGYRLVFEPDELDASRFEATAARGRAALAGGEAAAAAALLREALDLWRGPALADFADEPFARGEAVRLEQLRLAALEDRLWADLELGRHGEVVEELRDLTSRHPFREVFWEELMLALYRSGRQAEALRTFEQARVGLSEELGIDPGPALRKMEERILAQDPTLDFVQTDAGPGSVVSSLPVIRTSFIGRDQEIALGSDLMGRSRLLTLTGPPGSGKTRLALRLATEQASRYPHGTFFVPLAAVRSPSRLLTTIADTLELQQSPGEQPLASLSDFLRRRLALLILDNFEQVVAAAPRVGELLDAAPGLTILVTSRIPLRIAGEQEFPVPPLRRPPHDQSPDVRIVDEYDATALFVARARSCDPTFRVTAANAAAIVAIVDRLDGLPLAIELAAGRLRMLTPQTLLDGLEQRLPLLTGGPTDTVHRHRTLHHAIEWSYQLLHPEERAFFRALGIFHAGFTLGAAAEVTQHPPEATWDLVDALVAGSLLYRPADAGEPRYGMLETLREFALDELAAKGELEATARRHAECFHRLASAAESDLTGDEQTVVMGRLSRDLDNVRAALQYSLDGSDPELGISLASSIWRFWQMSGRLDEGRQWLESLLERHSAATALRAKGLTALAGVAYWQADHEAAWKRYEEALAIYRSIGDRYNEAETLYGMSATATWNEDPITGERLADEARRIFEELEKPEEVGKVAMAQGFALWQLGEYAAARPLWEQGLAVARRLGDRALAVTQQAGLAGIGFHEGNLSEALRIGLQALEESTQIDNAALTVWLLDFVAAFTAPTTPEAAVRIAGAADALRESAGGGKRLELLHIDDARSAAAKTLSPRRLEELWADGRTMTLDQAIEMVHDLHGSSDAGLDAAGSAAEHDGIG